ncbi:hypothetical protein AX17_003418 [Amanita inopinata Kibby_2008]|nr:hypothetical protein AX17_003418 [Amanita inopinata Kibby_2008]
MPSAALQAKIAAFESLASHSPSSSLSNSPPSIIFLPKDPSTQDISQSLLETPISPTTATSLPPVVVQFTPFKAPRQTSPSPSPPNLGRKSSLIDLKDWVVEDGPSDTNHTEVTPLISAVNGHSNGSLKTSQNGISAMKGPPRIMTSLINLESPPEVKPKPKHLVSLPISNALDVPPLPPRKQSYQSLRSVASSSSLQTTANSYLYPPRPDKSPTANHVYPYLPAKLDVSLVSRNSSGHAPASSISSFHSVSLSSDTDPSTPSSLSNHIASFPVDQDHERDLSVKSHGSDSISLDESYEEVSSTSLASPATEELINLDWERATARQKPLPPKLPKRPSSSATSGISSVRPTPPRPPPPFVTPRSTPTSPITRPSSSSSSVSTLPSTHITIPPSRRMPPPSRPPDRGSTLNNGTSDITFSVNYPTYQSNQRIPPRQIPSTTLVGPSHKPRRPTPVPSAARKRYESLFDVNVIQWQKAEKQRNSTPSSLSPTETRRTRQAVGWRGLSIDLSTADEEHPNPNKAKEQTDGDEERAKQVVGSDEILEGHIVRCIWTRSGLSVARLREIW